jgi:replicative DNA helicase
MSEGDRQGDDLSHAPEAELAVLGGLLLDNSAWDRVGDILRAEHFGSNDNAAIFRAIFELIENNKPADAVSVAEQLRRRGALEASGGAAFLVQLAYSTPSSASVRRYAEIVRDRALRRALASSARKIEALARSTDGRSANALVDEAQSLLSVLGDAARRGVTSSHKLHDFLVQVMQKIDELHQAGGNAIIGVPTGFVDLDHMTTGLQRGDLIIVGGRPSMGKSAFAMNIVEHVAIEAKLPALVFSLEMSGYQLALRALASASHVHMQRLRTGRVYEEDWERLGKGLARLNDAPIEIDETGDITPFELRAKARRYFREYGGLGVIVVDYLQLMSPDRHDDNRANALSTISRALKQLAKELNVPVIALSQLNREVDHRPNKRPKMSDLRESGGLEQDADVILFMYRDEVYNEESPDKGTAEVIIAKQRNGPIGTVRLAWLNSSTRFENYAGRVA